MEAMQITLPIREDEPATGNAPGESVRDKLATYDAVVSLDPPKDEMRGRRPRLRSVDNTAVSSINALAAGRRWSGLGRDQAWDLALSGPVRLPHRQSDVLLALSWEGVRCILAFSYASAETLLEAKWGDMALNDVPPDLALALLQDATDELSRELAGEALGPIRIDGWGASVEACAAPFAFELRMARHGGGDPISAYLLTDLHGIQRFAQFHACAEQAPNDMEQWKNLPILLTLELGWVDMTLKEIATIRPQDVLLPDGWWKSKGKNDLCIRVSPKLGIGAQSSADEQLHATTKVKRMEQDDSQVQNPQHPGNVQQHTNGASAAVESGATDLTDIPLRISFDLGERQIPLRDLASIAPGYLFDLGLAPDSAVNLRINGVRVGEGELVEIGGRIGIAVMRMLPLQ